MYTTTYEEIQDIYHDQVLIGILKRERRSIELESLTHYPSEKKENIFEKEL